jgi:hypothetical protein
MGKVHLKDLCVNEWIILKWLLKEIFCEHEDRSHLAHDRVKFRAFVNTVLKLLVM